MTADAGLVRRLLRAQAPELADRPVRPGPAGWDNTHWLIGDDLAARLPRRRLAVPLVANEVRWLPTLAPQLPVAVPAPVHVGEPGEGWPWPWTIVPWLHGDRADLAVPPADPRQHAGDLGAVLAALHVPAPAGAPHNPHRSIPLADRLEAFDERVAALVRRGEDGAVAVLRGAVDAALAAPPHAGPPTWVHGDLHPGNQLVAERRLVALVDWGDVAAGDPAVDLATAWWTLPVAVHGILRDRVGRDEAAWVRAAGWAAVIAAYLLDQAPRAGDEVLEATARRTVAGLREMG